jgi:hypothetical protein
MARTPRTFSRRGRAEAKAGENIRQGKSREDVTKKPKHTNQQQEMVEVLPTRSLSRFVRVINWLPRLPSTSFHGWRPSDCRTWREGVLSLKHRRCNETKEYHRAQQSPHENDWLPRHENMHGRTSGDEERLTIATIILRKPPDISWTSFPFRTGFIAPPCAGGGARKPHPVAGFGCKVFKYLLRSSRNFTGPAGFQSPNHSSFHSYGRTKL